MTLTGSLDIFPLEEVLRLLARSRKTGCLRVECPDANGRIYLASGALSLVTTGSDDDLRRLVVNAGLVAESELRRVETGGATLVEVLNPGVPPALLTDLIREQIVEGLYQLRRSGAGTFDFGLDIEPRYPTGQTFDAEVAVSESDRRAAEWAEIQTVLTDLTVPLRMVRDLPDENDVTVSAPTWRVLANLDGGASVIALADALGMSRFRTAREIAGLLRARLVEPVPVPAAPAAPAPGAWSERTSWLTTPPAVEVRPEPAEASEPPTAQAPAADAAEETAAPPAAQAADEGPSSWMDPAPAVEGDTDRFLESVFAELDEPEAAEGDQGFSMGLLRRRRMGGAREDTPEI